MSNNIAEEKIKVVILAPKGKATGGPESLHRLFFEFNEYQNVEVHLCDPWFATKFLPRIQAYDVYKPRWSNVRRAKHPDHLIVHEHFPFIPRSLKAHKSRVFIWWLSLLNAHETLGVEKNFPSSSLWGEPVGQPFRRKRRAKEAVGKVLRELEAKITAAPADPLLATHLAQSRYAEKELNLSLGVESMMLQTPAERPGQLSQLRPEKSSRNIPVIAYNWEKSEHQIKILKPLLPKVDFLPIREMSREEVIRSIASADLYLDLGFFPGRDRLPREAGKIGCPVILANRGSAANPLDFPLADEFKVDMTVVGPNELAERLQTLLDESAADILRRQKSFFEACRNESRVWNQQVKHLMQSLKIE